MPRAALEIQPTDALIVVDVQNDFLPGGALAVAGGDRVLAPLRALLPRFAHVFATRDWHPAHHGSFAAQGGPWPAHCVQESQGAALSSALEPAHIDEIISKGINPGTEGYSGFDATDLEARLRTLGVRRLFVTGLATDYCVRATALDARKLGFDVIVLTDAIAAVNVDRDDEARALEELRAAGCRLITSESVVA